jgi:hypothetical protein
MNCHHDKALEALRLIMSATPIQDFIYTVRDHERKGWDGPRVEAFSKGVLLGQEALSDANIPIAPMWYE